MKNMKLIRKLSEICHRKERKERKLKRCKKCSKLKKSQGDLQKRSQGDLQNDFYKIVGCTATSVKLKRVPFYEAKHQASAMRAKENQQKIDSLLHMAPLNDPLLLNGDFSYLFAELNNDFPPIENLEPKDSIYFNLDNRNDNHWKNQTIHGRNTLSPSFDYNLENDSWSVSNFYYDSYIRFPSVEMT